MLKFILNVFRIRLIYLSFNSLSESWVLAVTARTRTAAKKKFSAWLFKHGFVNPHWVKSTIKRSTYEENELSRVNVCFDPRKRFGIDETRDERQLNELKDLATSLLLKKPDGEVMVIFHKSDPFA